MNSHEITRPSQTEDFNPILHQPPKYDIYGRQKASFIIPGSDPRNILKDKDNIIVPWDEKREGNTNRVTSRTELLNKRKMDKIPDKSYDLDGDGFVGGRDFVIAKRFDVDKDGKLNEAEKKNAIQAIYKGVEDEYVWNLENQGVTRPCRILQKRGKIIDLENFLPLEETYPRHPLKDVVPYHNSRSELLNKRKEETKKVIEEKTDLWEKHNPSQVYQEQVKRASSQKPKHTSIRQIKEEQLIKARAEANLLKERTEIKIVEKDPTLKYVDNPEVKTKADLKERLRKENFELSKKILSSKHTDEIERLRIREDEIFDMGYYAGERKTYSKVKEQKRKENVDYHMKTFSRQTIGVHGHELPKFSENDTYREYWKFREDWVENPKCISQVELLENQKFWKKKEELKLIDHAEIPEEINVKKDHIPIKKKDEILIKVNKLNHFKQFDPDHPVPIDIDNVKRKHIYRWTTLVNQFSNQKFKKGRYFDNLPVLQDLPSDEKALYSSFNEKGIFESKYGTE